MPLPPLSLCFSPTLAAWDVLNNAWFNPVPRSPAPQSPHSCVSASKASMNSFSSNFLTTSAESHTSRKLHQQDTGTANNVAPRVMSRINSTNDSARHHSQLMVQMAPPFDVLGGQSLATSSPDLFRCGGLLTSQESVSRGDHGQEQRGSAAGRRGFGWALNAKQSQTVPLPTFMMNGKAESLHQVDINQNIGRAHKQHHLGNESQSCASLNTSFEYAVSPFRKRGAGRGRSNCLSTPNRFDMTRYCDRCQRE
eukprot:GHVN01006187.1.p1 GENE.GHVN01006187.1~~GHVN01006187.1.p1  ORF type:complete len:252 (-),score=27.49 GHVN01006187.1:556-1311(-)